MSRMGAISRASLSVVQLALGDHCRGCAVVFVAKVSKGGTHCTAHADNSLLTVRWQQYDQLARAGVLCHQFVFQRSLALQVLQTGLGILFGMASAKRVRL